MKYPYYKNATEILKFHHKKILRMDVNNNNLYV